MNYTTCRVGGNDDFEGQNGSLDQPAESTQGRGLGGPALGAFVAQEGGGRVEPPSGNTGAQNTGEGKASITVDCLELTFHDLGQEAVQCLMSPEGSSDWAVLPRGRNGYRQGVVRGEVRVYFDGANDGMGVHAVAMGEGCRQLEAEGVVTQWDGTGGFLRRCLETGRVHVSRLDLAADDRAGLVTQERVETAIAERGCVSRFVKGRPVQDVTLSDASRGGWSYVFGAASSDARLRIYDKAAEQREKGREVPEGHWMRVELQLRNQKATEMACLLASDGASLGRLAAGRLWAYIDFREVDLSDSNKSRWETRAWWSEFLGNVEKVRWTGATVVRSLERAAEWFVRQVAPTFAALRFSTAHGQEWLDGVFGNGAERLPEWVMGALAAQRASAARCGLI